LQEGGVLLGAFPGIEFSSHGIPFGEGDRLVCYTDGVSETANARGEQFSDRRLVAVIARAKAHPEAVIYSMLSDLTRFSVSGEPDDDCTLLVLQGTQGKGQEIAHAP